RAAVGAVAVARPTHIDASELIQNERSVLLALPLLAFLQPLRGCFGHPAVRQERGQGYPNAQATERPSRERSRQSARQVIEPGSVHANPFDFRPQSPERPCGFRSPYMGTDAICQVVRGAVSGLTEIANGHAATWCRCNRCARRPTWRS